MDEEDKKAEEFKIGGVCEEGHRIDQDFEIAWGNFVVFPSRSI